jgi:hypothetical protein
VVATAYVAYTGDYTNRYSCARYVGFGLGLVVYSTRAKIDVDYNENRLWERDRLSYECVDDDRSSETCTARESGIG